jgi:metal-dependent HD superfamily phosphatase/phosphodiesterase
MKKFNGFESYNLVTGLELLRESYLVDINKAFSADKHHIFSERFANDTIDDLIKIIKDNTKRDKFANKA